MDKKLVLIRDRKTEVATFGALYVVEEAPFKRVAEYESLEPPWRDNKKNISCIPAGTYRVKKRWSPRHKHHLYIKGVIGRTWILIHPGNTVKETRGCILAGKELGFFNDDAEVGVTASRVALDEILELLPKVTTIEIRNE